MNENDTITLSGGAANDNGRDEIEARACVHCHAAPAVISGLCGVCFCEEERELNARGFDWRGERF